MLDKIANIALGSLKTAEDEANRLGLLYSAGVAYHRNAFKEALELYEQYLARYPATYAVLVYACHSYLQLDQPEKALPLCDKMVALHPKGSGPYAERAFVHVRLYDADSAIEDADHSISLNDKHSHDAYYSRSCARRQKYQYQAALSDCEKMISIRPTAFAFIQRASVKLGLNQVDAAKSDCALAFSKLDNEIPPNTYSKFLNMRATILGAANEIENAIHECTRALQFNPANSTAYINRSYYHSRLKNLDAAVQDLNKAAVTASKQDQEYIQSNRARLELLKGNVQGALELTTNAVEIAPNRSSLVATHGLALMRNERFDAAEQALTMAIDLDSYETEAYWFRGELYALKGDVSKSEADKAIAREWNYIPYL